MQEYTLRRYTDKTILYKGKFKNFTTCLETAISKNVPLSYIDLKNKNLINANLDGAIIPYADFTNSNLSGANLSESNINNSKFCNCSLYNTCLSYSNINNCNFQGASFGATLINGANIKNSIFSTLSCFSLNFIDINDMSGCTYISHNYKPYNMSNTPIIIKGILNTPIVIFDDFIKIGNKSYCKSNTPQISKFINSLFAYCS